MATRKPLPLTKARAARAVGRTFMGTTLRNNAAVESRYVNELQALVAQMTATTRREVLALFKSEAAGVFFAQDTANIASQARILVNSLNDRFNALFAHRAPRVARRMIDGAAAASKTALHGSLEKLTGGLSLKTSIMTPQLQTVYKAQVAQNVSLIKTIARDYLSDVEGSVMRSITTGRGLQDLVPELQKYEGYSHRKAKNVALDQTRKTYNAINRDRMTAIGVKKFQWIHSGGGHKPRPDHVEMDGNIYSFDDPPIIDEKTGERGIPGQAINCKCTMRPVFQWGDDEKPVLGDEVAPD